MALNRDGYANVACHDLILSADQFERSETMFHDAKRNAKMIHDVKKTTGKNVFDLPKLMTSGVKHPLQVFDALKKLLSMKQNISVQHLFMGTRRRCERIKNAVHRRDQPKNTGGFFHYKNRKKKINITKRSLDTTLSFRPNLLHIEKISRNSMKDFGKKRP